jgi:HK97 family phage prohead protease
MSAPTENLVRSAFVDRGTTVKHDGDRPKLHGYFSTFNDWYEVNSTREGRFMERLAPGAFTRTLTENRDRIKVLYDHGMDPQLANKPLGHWTAGEDSRGAWYDVELIDTDYNRNFVIPAGDAGLLGSSFRFSVADKGESWSTPTRSANHNPHRLRERTITDVDVYEFGPVTFPANGAVGAVGPPPTNGPTAFSTTRSSSLDSPSAQDSLSLSAFSPPCRTTSARRFSPTPREASRRLPLRFPPRNSARHKPRAYVNERTTYERQARSPRGADRRAAEPH